MLHDPGILIIVLVTALVLIYGFSGGVIRALASFFFLVIVVISLGVACINSFAP